MLTRARLLYMRTKAHIACRVLLLVNNMMTMMTVYQNFNDGCVGHTLRVDLVHIIFVRVPHAIYIFVDCFSSDSLYQCPSETS